MTVPGIGGFIPPRSAGWLGRRGSCKEDKRMRSDFGSMRFFSWHINTTSKLKVRQEVRAAFDSCLMRGGTSLKHTRRRDLQLIAAAAITPALRPLSGPKAGPAKPIRVIIPFSAGSTIDIVARIVFEPLGRQLGQALVIDNRSG